MKKLIASLLVVVLIIAYVPVNAGFADALGVKASALSVNASEVKIFGLDSWAEDYLTIPSGFKTSFQLAVKGAKSVSYRVSSGDSVTVTAAGLIKPNYTVWYWNGNVGTTYPSGQEGEVTEKQGEYGKSVITVTADGVKYTVNVEFVNYAEYYADSEIDRYIKNNITPAMSITEKLNKICEYPASFDYSAEASGYVSMILTKGGDCWASTALIIRMCEKLGIKAWSRNGNRDLGAGSGHMNALIEYDGVYYELEAGFYEDAPRQYSVTVRNSLFSYSYVSGGIKVYQYDGYDDGKTVLEIPSVIDGKTVVAVGDDFLSLDDRFKTVIIPDTVTKIGSGAFNSCEALENLTIPASVTEIGDFAFTNCNKLKNLSCSSENAYYTVQSGVLYNKNMTVLLFCPYASSVNIPSSVTEIKKYSFYYNNQLKTLTIPSTVTTIGEGAAGNCNSLTSVKIKDGVKSIGNYAFCNDSELKTITIPDSVTEIGKSSLGCFQYGEMVENFNLICNPGSAAERYAEENGLEHSTADISGFTAVISAKKYYYNGKAVTPAVTLKNNSSIIPKDNYTVTYSGNNAPGKAYITVNGCNNYKGKITLSFTIAECTHKYGDWELVTAPTCTESGSRQRVCSICKNKQKSTIVPMGHLYSEAWTVDKAATYTSDGSKSHHCLRCDYKTGVTKIPMLTLSAPKLSQPKNYSAGIKVSWQTVKGATGYKVYRKTGSGKWTLLYKADSKTVSFTDSTAECGKTYIYTVRSFNKSNSGTYNKTGVKLMRLTQPGVTAANSAGGATVKWNKITGATGYYVYRKVGSETKWTKIATVKKSSTVTYTDKTAKSGRSYRYTVRAYCGSYLSSYSAGVETVFLSVPSLSSIKSTGAGITVKWGKTVGASGYYVYRKQGNGKWSRIKAVSGNSSVSFTDATAKKGITYTYTVRAYKNSYMSAYHSGLKCKAKY